MRTKAILIGLLLAMAAPILAPAQTRARVVPAERRTATLAKAAALLQPQTPNLPAEKDLVNPFAPRFSGPVAAAPAGPAPASAAREEAPVTDRVVLEAVAATIRPSGAIFMGGEYLLLFGERRIRAGDFLTVQYSGRDYLVRVAAIASNSFTLRLNQEELSRPIN